MTNKQKSIERYFKAIGCEHQSQPPKIIIDGIPGECVSWWSFGNQGEHGSFQFLPDIIDHYPSFKKWVLERMRKEGFTALQIGENYIYWFSRLDYVDMSDLRGDIKEGQDDLLAAVEAATKYWESKNADK